MNTTKEVFAQHLRAGLLNHYQGNLPSFSVIARDFTLRAPDLPPVSSETIRHWLRGQSLPHVSRMQVLLGWLGPELTGIVPSGHGCFCHHDDGKVCQQDKVQLCSLIEKLSKQESDAMLVIVQMLAAQHGLSRTD